MNRLKEINQQIKKLEKERIQIIRTKTVSYGELIDTIKKLFTSDKMNEVCFAEKLDLALTRIKGN